SLNPRARFDFGIFAPGRAARSDEANPARGAGKGGSVGAATRAQSICSRHRCGRRPMRREGSARTGAALAGCGSAVGVGMGRAYNEGFTRRLRAAAGSPATRGLEESLKDVGGTE